jgi:hypothetical protein
LLAPRGLWRRRLSVCKCPTAVTYKANAGTDEAVPSGRRCYCFAAHQDSAHRCAF